MTYLDYIILFILLVFLVKGAYQGFIKQVLTIAGWIAGIILAWLFYPVLAIEVIKIGLPSVLAVVISFLLIYAAVVYTTKLLSQALSKTAKMLFLGWLNRLLGAVFGLLEGFLLVIIVLFLVSFTPYERSIRSAAQRAPVVKIMKNIVSTFVSKPHKTNSELKILDQI